MCGPMVCATRSAGSRLISAHRRLRPSSTKPSSPSTVSDTSSRARRRARRSSSKRRMNGPDGAGGVVVLGLAEQQRRAALDVAQVDVVAERRADDAPSGTPQHHFRLGVVPVRAGVQPGVRAGADGGHRRALGEDLGVRADADLEILAPRALLDASWFDESRQSRHDGALSRALHELRLTREELQSGKPIIGIAQTGSDLSPCNRHHLELAHACATASAKAGGIPFEFPGASDPGNRQAPDRGARPQPRLSRPRRGAVRLSDRRRRADDRLRQDHARLLMAAATVDIPRSSCRAGRC
jgi:hypothetical protein